MNVTKVKSGNGQVHRVDLWPLQLRYGTDIWLAQNMVGNARFIRVLNWPTHSKKAQFTQELVK
jgi:hypothetical protein